MPSIVITERNGAQRTLVLDKPEISIGRTEGNDVLLPKNNVSKRHSRLLVKDRHCVLVDLKSTNGTYVNGRRISSPSIVHAGDKVYIGDFILTLLDDPPAASGPPLPEPTTASDPPASDSPQRDTVVVKGPPAFSSPPEAQAPGPDRAGDGARAERSAAVPRSARTLPPADVLQRALCEVLRQLAAHVELHRPHESVLDDAQCQALERIVDQVLVDTEGERARAHLFEAARDEAVALGALSRLLANDAVQEIVVEGPARVWVDLGAGLAHTSARFSSPEAILTVARRLFRRAGRSVDEREPIQYAALPGIGQLQVVLPPLCETGPLLAIRTGRNARDARQLVADETLSEPMLELLGQALELGVNTLVVGPRRSGVSTLLAALGTDPGGEARTLALELSPTPWLQHPHLTTLNRGAGRTLGLGELLEHAARLRAERLIVDDVQSAEIAPLLLHAAARGGVMAGMHAASAEAALEQLEAFGHDGGPRAGVSLIARAFGLLAETRVGADGQPRVTRLAEIAGTRGETLIVKTLFHYADGFAATEHRPSFGE